MVIRSIDRTIEIPALDNEGKIIDAYFPFFILLLLFLYFFCNFIASSWIVSLDSFLWMDYSRLIIKEEMIIPTIHYEKPFMFVFYFFFVSVFRYPDTAPSTEPRSASFDNWMISRSFIAAFVEFAKPFLPEHSLCPPPLFLTQQLTPKQRCLFHMKIFLLKSPRSFCKYERVALKKSSLAGLICNLQIVRSVLLLNLALLCWSMHQNSLKEIVIFIGTWMSLL